MYKMTSLSLDEYNELKQLEKEYWKEKETHLTRSGGWGENQDSIEQTEESFDKVDGLYYTLLKEDKNMSLMILLYDGKHTYIGTDSRENFNDGSYNDNCQKLFVNKNKTMAASFTGIIKKTVNNETINFPKEISDLLFSGKNIYEALNTTRLNGKNYLELIGNDFFHIFIAEKDKVPTIIDIDLKEIKIAIPRITNRIYSAGDCDTISLNNIISTKLSLGAKCEDVIKYMIEDTIRTTNEIKKSTIGGKAQLITI